MTNEQKAEIIKSLAYGMSAEDISKFENVSSEEIEQIAYDCADEIARKKEYLESIGRV